MKAAVSACYGSPDVLEIVEVPQPKPKADEVLIKVHATTVTRTDDGLLRPHPFFIRLSTGLLSPKCTTLGMDFAGTVDAIGADVTSFEPGERVEPDLAGGEIAQRVQDTLTLLRRDLAAIELHHSALLQSELREAEQGQDRAPAEDRGRKGPQVPGMWRDDRSREARGHHLLQPGMLQAGVEAIRETADHCCVSLTRKDDPDRTSREPPR